MNRMGKDFEGHCCSGYRTASGKCSGLCSTKFRVCLKHYQTTIDPSQECTFGEEVTPILGANNVLVKSASPIQFPLDFKWPGTFSLIVEAWHENNKSSGKIFVFQKLQMLEVKSVGSQFGGKLIVSDDELEREVNWNPSRILFIQTHSDYHSFKNF